MGLADRPYMHDDAAHSRPDVPAWLVLLVVNVIAFFVEFSHGNHSEYFYDFLKYGGLSLDGIKHGWVWQFLTFQFLHAELWHLLVNMFVLYSFGRAIEYMLGKRRFLKLYFLSGFAGGFAQILLALVSSRFADPSAPTVGASAGICGLIAAFALLNPNSVIYLFFILPIRALYFLPLLIAVSLGLLVYSFVDYGAHGAEFGGQIANGAHLGGILAGIAYVRWGDTIRASLSRWRPFQSRQRRREFIKAASMKFSRWPHAQTEEPADPPSEEFISREVDPILDKISAHGIQSLTDRERRILETARAKMAKR